MATANPKAFARPVTQRAVRRPKSKEEKKLSPEERLLQRWEQQVFFLKKVFPQSEKDIVQIRKQYEQKTGKDRLFSPSEEAIVELMELYADLKQTLPPQTPAFRI